MRRLKRAISDVLCSRASGRLVARLTGGRMRSRGCTLDLSHPAVPPETRATVFFGFYERWERRYVEAWLPPDLDVIELGSSMGVVAATIARRLAGRRRLVCVEANPALLPVIETSLRLNGGGAAVLVNAALSYEPAADGTVSFSVGESHLVSRLSAGGDGARQVTVPAVQLGALATAQGFQRFALVCDIEGAEAGLLWRDEAALARCDALIIELHGTRWQGRALTIEDLAARISELGFRLAARHGPVHAFLRAPSAPPPG